MRFGLAGITLVAAFVAAHGDADARARRRHRRRAPPTDVPSPPAARRSADREPVRFPSRIARAPAVDEAVRCSCATYAECPVIGTLAIGEHRRTPIFCNQRNGVQNPGVRTASVWYYQCVELANRWLTSSVGTPAIGGHAKHMCDNASPASYEVHRRGAPHAPVPGDLLVWDGTAMGHVAVVTSVSRESIVVANQNYGDGGRQYPFLRIPRTAGFFGAPPDGGSLRAKCIVHPKRLRH